LALDEFGEELLPSRIFLCGGGSLLPDIVEVLSQDKWRRGLPFSRKPKIEFSSLKNISFVIDKTSKLSAPEDITPVSLVSMSLELIGEETVLDKILNQAVKSLRT